MNIGEGKLPVGLGSPARSLWEATAGAPVQTPPLLRSCRADVAIVGAGYTGLAAGLHLAHLGIDVCVLEAAEPGWGASGRNGGQVIPGLKHDPDDMLRRFGEDGGSRLIELVGGAADNVFDLITRHHIDCDAKRQGWIQPAHSASVLESQHRRVTQWKKRGAPVELLAPAEVAARTGARTYVGGWIDLRAGSVHPLNYLRGLVRVATRLGARIHGGTTVTGLARDGGRWLVRTSGGHTVNADQVLIATNGYPGDLWPGLRRSIIAANSLIVATAPLPAAVDATILPGGEVASDSRRLLLYFRKDAAGRLLIGGRGSLSDPACPKAWAHLDRARERLFPQSRGVAVQYRWAGRVAVTRDAMPHVHAPEPGLMIALGYNGRGIAMATTLGKELAAAMAKRGELSTYPVTTIRPIPLHGLQRLYFATAVARYRLLDRFA